MTMKPAPWARLTFNDVISPSQLFPVCLTLSCSSVSLSNSHTRAIYTGAAEHLTTRNRISTSTSQPGGAAAAGGAALPAYVRTTARAAVLTDGARTRSVGVPQVSSEQST